MYVCTSVCLIFIKTMPKLLPILHPHNLNQKYYYYQQTLTLTNKIDSTVHLVIVLNDFGLLRKREHQALSLTFWNFIQISTFSIFMFTTTTCKMMLYNVLQLPDRTVLRWLWSIPRNKWSNSQTLPYWMAQVCNLCL